MGCFLILSASLTDDSTLTALSSMLSSCWCSILLTSVSTSTFSIFVDTVTFSVFSSIDVSSIALGAATCSVFSTGASTSASTSVIGLSSVLFKLSLLLCSLSVAVTSFLLISSSLVLATVFASGCSSAGSDADFSSSPNGKSGWTSLLESITALDFSVASSLVTSWCWTWLFS